MIAPETPPALPAAPIASAQTSAFAFHEAGVLGTQLNLVINAENGRRALAAALRARSEIDRLDEILNWRSATSELGRLNRTERHVGSPDLYTVIAAAERWREATRGAFSGRLGRVLAAWLDAGTSPPAAAEVGRLAEAAASARVEIDEATRTIIRPDVVRFDLDALAKGYIVDRALEVVMASPGIRGALVDIGGDIRCAGQAPFGRWLVGLPDPLTPFDNAPLAGSIAMHDGAVATSGLGPRDRPVGGAIFSATLDPRTGWPIPREQSATAIADSAMEADALATSLLNLSPEASAELVRSMPGASARLARGGSADWLSGDAAVAQWIPTAARPTAPLQQKSAAWPEGWVALVTFSAPPRQMQRERAFRSPYVAIWITDSNNRPVRTLLLIGSIKEWQENNYIWWGSNRTTAQRLVDSRSMSTRGTGEYRVLWDGIDERGAQVAPGRYHLHVETSRERGGHTHRTLELDVSKAREFTAELPLNGESGGLVVSFERYGLPGRR